MTLRAVDALRRSQQTFTRDQVAYLIALAYESGRLAAAGEDLAETVACWTEPPIPRRTRAERIAQRVASYDTGRRPHPGGPVDWETGRPLRRPEPYTSPANGTALGVAEREAFGELGRAA